MEKQVKFSCPMNCFDLCALVASVVNGKVVKIRGDETHPLTKGTVCKKGLKILERQYHPKRLTYPQKKIGDQWTKITWDDAVNEIAEKVSKIIKDYGSSAILNYSDRGYEGLIKSVDEIFFNYLGGVTVPRGSLCWGAGLAAQRYDFGEVKAHRPEDISHAKTILIWGRNPVDTNIHLVSYLTQAQKSGASTILIDPLKTATAKLTDDYIPIRPATDGALALGMAREIIENDLLDPQFIKNHVHGFEPYKDYVKQFTLGRIENITGIEQRRIAKLAKTYALNKPSCIILGYGLQRYKNSGNTIRCIDALAAITGNLGISGAGVNYADKTLSRYISGEITKSKKYAKNRRSFVLARLGDFLEKENNPPIKAIFISKANPLVQIPNIHKTLKAFQSVEFKVVIDMFMTDTAASADLVLPCTTVLEEEDIFFNSMFSPYMHFSHKAVDPPAGVMSEYDFFMMLAERLEISSYPCVSREEFLKSAIRPITEEFGIGYNDLKNRFFTIPQRKIPWKGGIFSTPSGKYELYSEKALKDGNSPIPVFGNLSKGDKDHCLRLITPHAKDSLHSQHFAFKDDRPQAYLNSRTLRRNALKVGAQARICSKHGELIATVKSDDHINENIVMIYQGWWHKSGSVNYLTQDCTSDMGEQAAYYDCFCQIEPVPSSHT
jgi:anaerobic selenocysteine-containing dehydrogenase